MSSALPDWIIYAIGFCAQALFASRTLFQWLLSEKEHRVTSPTLFWVISVAGSLIMSVYGVLRDDFSIILGQFIAYYIYLWNLKAKGVWEKLHILVRALLLAAPVVLAALVFNDADQFLKDFFHNEKIPFGLVLFGSAGQIIFTLRFVYQWVYSRRRGESVLPRGFWIISLIGSGTIIAYALVRKDPVLILGQSFGFVAYVRNLMIGSKSQEKRPEDDPGGITRQE